MKTLIDAEGQLNGRDRARLAQARVNGYLDAGSAFPSKLAYIHSFWCWRLRLPLVWFERHSPRSRYARVRLDLFATPNSLNQRGQAELAALAAGQISAGDARWEKVPVEAAEKLAHAAFRIATRPANYEPRRAGITPEIERMFAAIRSKMALKISA